MPKAFSKHSIEISGTRILYWTNNNQTKPPILFVHGFRGDHRGLLETAKYFKDYYCIIPDLPGYGVSDTWTTKKHTLQNYAEFLDMFCKSLHLQKYTVIGHSLGATLAIIFAQKFPSAITKIALVAPVVSSHSIEGTLTALYYNVARVLPTRIRRTFMINQLTDAFANAMLLKSAPLKKKLTLIRDGLQNIEHLREIVIIENFISIYETDPFIHATKLSMPVIIFAGTRDRLCPKHNMKKLCATMPNCIYTPIPHEGHIVPLEHPKLLSSYILHSLAV
jgi:pimeloyl-ACP methyl ester carboxylesterase